MVRRPLYSGVIVRQWDPTLRGWPNWMRSGDSLMQTVKAIFRKGVLQPLGPLTLAGESIATLSTLQMASRYEPWNRYFTGRRAAVP
jgi:hypothetical protein